MPYTPHCCKCGSIIVISTNCSGCGHDECQTCV